MEHGWIGELTFKKVGLLLLLAVSLSGIVWGAMKVYVCRVEAEYEAAGAPFDPDVIRSQGGDGLKKEDIDGLMETSRRYWKLQDTTKGSFSWYYNRAETAFIASVIGLFLWFLTLLGRGILWILGRRK